MLKWLSHKIINWSNEYVEVQEKTRSYGLVSTQDEAVRLNEAIRFKIQPAQGGSIVEVASTDKKSGDYVFKMYVIAEGEDIGEFISNIVTMELLRRS